MFLSLINFLNYTFWGNSLGEYLMTFFVFVFSVVVLRLFKRIVIVKVKQIAGHTKTDFDDLLIKIIESIGWPFYVFLPVYAALQFIKFAEGIEKLFSTIALVLVSYYFARAGEKLIDYAFDKLAKRRKKEDGQADSSALELLNKISKGALWALVILIVLQNLGYNISTLIAGLGIGGVAIAFAVQNILSDVFSSFSIYFDKPFQVGDFIVIGEEKGVVKRIGIKSTRIQTLQGEELVISNRDLTDSRVHNYKKMRKRRVTFSFGVTYETQTEKLKKIPEIVKEIVEKAKLAELDRVHFKSFGDFSLNFEVVYYLNSSDYKDYMDTQQEINLALKDRFEKEGIDFAYPTETIFLKKS